MAEFHRAYQTRSRSHFWHNIVAKSGFDVEILFESDDREMVKRKEIEFISLYGTQDLKTGILVNLTIGGDNGCFKIGHKHSAEARKKISQNKKGYKHPPEVIERMKLNKKQNPQIAWNKGRGKPLSEESKSKKRLAMQKHYSDPEYCKKLGANKKGKSSWNKGVPMLADAKSKRTENRKKKFGGYYSLSQQIKNQ